MPHTPETSSSILDQLSEIQSEAERNKVQLTPEIQAYIRTHLEAVQQKLANGEQLFEEDLAFIKDVRLWVSLPEESRKKYKSIDEMKKSEEVNELLNMALKKDLNPYQILNEASERQITVKQWLDVLHVAEAVNENKEWIDETFKFPGGGRIETEKHLILRHCTTLTRLPNNLNVNGELDLSYCTNFTTLPDNLNVGRKMSLDYCESLTSLPDNLRVGGYLSLEGCFSLNHLPDNFNVNDFLNLNSCTSLTCLPDNLHLNGSLWIRHCKSLTHLPDNLKIDEDILLSEDLQDRVKEDVERLKKEGKIKGGSTYKY